MAEGNPITPMSYFCFPAKYAQIRILMRHRVAYKSTDGRKSVGRVANVRNNRNRGSRS